MLGFNALSTEALSARRLGGVVPVTIGAGTVPPAHRVIFLGGTKVVAFPGGTKTVRF